MQELTFVKTVKIQKTNRQYQRSLKISILVIKIQSSKTMKIQLSLKAKQSQFLGYIMAVFAPDWTYLEIQSCGALKTTKLED